MSGARATALWHVVGLFPRSLPRSLYGLGFGEESMFISPRSNRLGPDGFPNYRFRVGLLCQNPGLKPNTRRLYYILLVSSPDWVVRFYMPFQCNWERDKISERGLGPRCLIINIRAGKTDCQPFGNLFHGIRCNFRSGKCIQRYLLKLLQLQIKLHRALITIRLSFFTYLFITFVVHPPSCFILGCFSDFS